jgi:lycopene cyclase domain-containing protein
MVTLINHLTATRGNYLSHVFMAWGIALIPMFVVNGLLTGLPILIYDDAHNSGIRISTIPIEDFFYNLLFMTWMVWVFEHFRQKPLFKEAAKIADL